MTGNTKGSTGGKWATRADIVCATTAVPAAGYAALPNAGPWERERGKVRGRRGDREGGRDRQRRAAEHVRPTIGFDARIRRDCLKGRGP